MSVIILNTGCSNLMSIKIAIEKLGYHPIISADASVIRKSKKIVLPGVGTAASAMKVIFENKLVHVIKKINVPVLGICLGMQLLCSFSEECSGIKTLGILNSSVVPLRSNVLPLPHIGWNKLNFNTPHQLFKNIPNQSRFYFVHSYMVPINQHTIATAQYDVEFSAVIQKNNFLGVQFHPEKSGDIGSILLKNFLEM